MAYLPTQTTLEILKKIEPSLIIYDCVSNFEAYPGAPKNIRDTERPLIEKNVVIVDSIYLFNKVKNQKGSLQITFQR